MATGKRKTKMGSSKDVQDVVHLMEGLKVKEEEEKEVDPKCRVRNRIICDMKARDLLVPFSRHKPDGQMKIPYFRGCQEANKRVTRMIEFKRAKVIKVNPSLAQMTLRKLILQSGKDLLVPVPALEDVFFHHLKGSDLGYKGCSKKGAAKHGTPYRVEDLDPGSPPFHIDVCVVGSVAVCAQNGARLGKGKGYAELEWAVFKELNMVSERTTVLTTVHPAQLVSEEELPAEVLESHDLPVDVIVTPSRIYNVRQRVPRPVGGVEWDKVTEETMKAVPLLKELQRKM